MHYLRNTQESRVRLERVSLPNTIRGAHILVVEDSPTNMTLVSHLLGYHGYVVSRAVDAKQALEAIQQKTPDLI